MAGYEQFVNLKYKPTDKDLIVSFKVKVPKWSTSKRAWGAVASESSVGTWSDTKASHYKNVQAVAAKVFYAKGDYIKIAYPQDHFEPGNMSQILASVAGNVFDMKAVDSLRLEDIQFPKKLVKSFKGPEFGRTGVRKLFKVKKRPLLISVAKPKVGLTTKQHVQVGKEIWSGGLDLLKDDENLSNQKFNPFNKRVSECLKVRDKVEKETGEKKSYLINVTGPTVKEMSKRAKFIKDHGGEYMMIDIITTGWAALNSMKEVAKDYGLIIHAHRAMHGAFTRNKDQGISMYTVGKIARLIGVDQLHTGTANVGKMTATKREVIALQNLVTQKSIKANRLLHTLDQDWYGKKAVFPVSSGGLHPLVVDKVMDALGTNIMLQAGGGVHGHPSGSYAGAKAFREAVDAYMRGESILSAAKKSPELTQALDLWGRKAVR